MAGVILRVHMKSRRRILVAVSSLALVAGLSFFPGCSKSDETAAPAASTTAAPAAAPASPQVPANGKSATSTAIASHLEFGGEFFVVVDTKGDIEKLGDNVADLIASGFNAAIGASASTTDVRALMKRLGLYDIDGLGLSSWQAANDPFHHNRTFVYTPHERQGLLKIFGAPSSAPFVTANELAPADADIVVESQADLKSLVDLVKSYVKDVGGQPAVDEMDATLKQPIGPGSTLTFQGIVDHLNTRYLFIARGDPSISLPLGPGATMPAVDFLIGIDGMADVLDQLEPMLTSSLPGKTATKNGMKTITLDLGLPPPYQLVFVADPKTKRLYLASRESFTDDTIFAKGSRLNTSPDFKAATTGLPDKGTGLFYLSQKGQTTIMQIAKQAMSGMPGSMGDQSLALYFPGWEHASHGQASVETVLKDGILYESFLPTSTKSLVVMAPVLLVGLVGATAIPAAMPARAQAGQSVITNNLRQISIASMTYMLDKGVTEVRYQDLIAGPKPYLQPLTPVAGESYNNIVVRQTTTRISVTTASGQVVSLDM